MFTIKGIILIISLMYCLKLFNYIFIKIFTYPSDNFHFYINIKKDILNCMSNAEFQEFCKKFFESSNNYSKVEFSSMFNKNKNDLLLTCYNNEKVYVHCLRNDNDLNNEHKISYKVELNFCKDFVDFIFSQNISKAIIITPSMFDASSLDYINKVNSSTNLDLSILDLDDIIKLIETKEKKELSTVTI